MHHRPAARITLLPAALTTIAGCTVGPDYTPPRVDTPGSWTQPTPGGSAADLRRWWASLSDPLLDSLITRAVDGNFDLRIAAGRIAEAKALRAAAETGALPTVDMTSAYQRQRASSDLVTGGNNRAHDFFSVGFDASWELDVWGAVRRAVESADAAVSAANEYRRDVMVALLAEVARNYIELRTFQARIVIAEANIKAQQETLNLTKARFNAGLTSELDPTRATANLETTRSIVPALQTGERFAAHRLAALLGLHPGALLTELSSTAPIPAAAAEVPIGLPSDLLRRRPDLRRAERDLATQHAQIGVAVADLYPRFTLNGSIGLEASQFTTMFDASSRAYSAGPSMRWRILDFGRIRANIQVQEARTQQALDAYQGAIIAALADVENALIAHSREQVRRRSLSAAVDAAKRSVELADSLYTKGLTDFQVVLDAQRALFLLQDELAASDGVVSVNLVALYKALGGGWDDAASAPSMPASPTPQATPAAAPASSSASPWASPVSPRG